MNNQPENEVFHLRERQQDDYDVVRDDSISLLFPFLRDRLRYLTRGKKGQWNEGELNERVYLKTAEVGDVQ